MARSSLTCITHERRVIVMRVTDDIIIAVHRNGKDKDRCDSSTFDIGDRTFTATEIVNH